MNNIQQDPPKRNSYLHIYEDPNSPNHLRISAGTTLHKKAACYIGLVLLGLLLRSLNMSGATELIKALIH